MRALLITAVAVLAAAGGAFTFFDDTIAGKGPSSSVEGSTPGLADEASVVGDAETSVARRRREGPQLVALQAGHWKAAEAPDEQAGLRNNGTRGGGKAEWEVNLEIARRAAAILEQAGYSVEILPTTIPPGYWADLFISIHADGNASTSISGFRAAAPRRDRTGRAHGFVQLLERSYAEATGLPHYPNVTRRMTGYYAFNSRRYQHSLDPSTVGVIIETGFLTSPADRRILLNAPERAARGIAGAAIQYLEAARLADASIPPPSIVRSQPQASNLRAATVSAPQEAAEADVGSPLARSGRD